jgi:hypothetical protein
MSITINSIMATKPDKTGWSRKRVEAWFGCQWSEIVTALRDSTVPHADRVWLITNMLPQSQRILWACDCALRALRHEREASRKPDTRSAATVLAAQDYVAGTVSLPELQAMTQAAALAAQQVPGVAAREAMGMGVAAASEAAEAADGAAWAAWAAARIAVESTEPLKAAEAAAFAAESATRSTKARTKEQVWQVENAIQYLNNS